MCKLNQTHHLVKAVQVEDQNETFMPTFIAKNTKNLFCNGHAAEQQNHCRGKKSLLDLQNFVKKRALKSCGPAGLRDESWTLDQENITFRVSSRLILFFLFCLRYTEMDQTLDRPGCLQSLRCLEGPLVST